MTTTYEFQITAIRPDTSEDIRNKIKSVVEEALGEGGHGDLLVKGQLLVDHKENFPDIDHETLVIVVQVASKMAYDVFKAYVLPRLKRLGEVREKPKTK